MLEEASSGVWSLCVLRVGRGGGLVRYRSFRRGTGGRREKRGRFRGEGKLGRFVFEGEGWTPQRMYCEHWSAGNIV